MDLGFRGEMRAALHLDALGWTLLERGFRCRAGEIDLVALDGGTLVFVEVKTRASIVHGLPERAVSLGKRLRIIASARAYLQRRRARPFSVRFDVAAVTPHEIRLVRGAFAPGGWQLPLPRPTLQERLARFLRAF
jgi:putative endonuclease